MPVVRCPNCRKSIAIESGSTGRKSVCPYCQKTFVIAVKKPPGETRKESEKPAKAKAPARRRRRGYKPSTLILAGFGVVAVIAMATAFFLLRGRTTPKVPVEVAEKKPVVESPKKEVPAAKVIDPAPKLPTGKEELAPPAIPLEEQLATFVARLNVLRQGAKLPTIVIDADLSRGCQAHADYIAKNRYHPRLTGPGAFQIEDPDLPGYTAEGRKAALASFTILSEPLAALDHWASRVINRPPLLQPELERIGLGAARTERGEWITVFDSTRGHAVPTVAFPAAGQKNVPLTFSGGPEAEADAGFPVSLQFPQTKSPIAVNAFLADERGNRIPILLSTPEDPLPGVRRPGLIGMIPKQPMAPKSVYKASVEAKVDGMPFKKEWQFTTEDDGDESGALANIMLERLNRARRQAQLAPVTLDDELSKGCRLHAKYLAMNLGRPEVDGLGAHHEDPKLPGYSPDGEKAAKASNVTIGNHEPPDALEGCMATLYHRIPILEPDLRKIGFGCARVRRLGWATVFNVASGRDKGPRSSPVYYPAEDQKDVPLNFPPGGEIPNPIPDDKTGRAGYPITAFFPFQLPLLKAQGKLVDSKGTEVPCWFSSPETPANPQFAPNQGTTVCLIPKEPLKSQETYRVTLTGEQAGDAFKKAWTFTTAKTGGDGSQAVESTLLRLNQVREAAGLSKVTLDPKLTKGCQAHADYLVKNAAAIRTKGFNVNDEIDSLPGYTPEGQKAAQRSSVLSLAPSPTMQIDDLVGTLHRRSFLLEPRLRRIGLGCAHDVAVGWFNVLDLSTGRDDGEPVVFPGPGQKNVPLLGRDKLPRSSSFSGFPITVIFPGQPTITKVRALLTMAPLGSADVVISSPEMPLDKGASQGNIIAIFPVERLRPTRAYTLRIDAEVNGEPWNYTGNFTTTADE